MRKSSYYSIKKTQWIFLNQCHKYNNSSISKLQFIQDMNNTLKMLINYNKVISQEDLNNLDVKNKFFKKEHKSSINILY